MMDLRINQRFGLIGLDIKPPAFQMKVRHPRLDLEITPPELQIEQKLPQLEIDQTQCFMDMDRRPPMEFLQHIVGRTRTAVLQAIARIADEGDMLGAIEKGIDIADIALMNSQEWKEFNVAAVPEHRPEIDVIIEKLDVALVPGDVGLNVVNGQINGYLDWGRVKVFWRQKPYIDIEYIGRRVDVIA
jgi:hypothetical protein